MKLLLIAVTVLFVLTQCKSTDHSVVEVQNQNSSIDIEGHWTLINSDIIEEKQSVERYVESTEPYKVQEWSPPVYRDNAGIIRPHSQLTYLSGIMKNLDISEDSIFGMNYPLELLQRNSYTIDSDNIQIGNDTDKKSIKISPNGDTLQISYLDNFGLYLEETYVKAVYDEIILNILKLYKTNFPLLAGNWKLIREEDLEYGAAFVLDFPYEIPDTIVITKEELESTLHTDRSYNMMTSDKKQKYFLKYYNSVLQLIPDNWCLEIDPFIRFVRINEDDK